MASRCRRTFPRDTTTKEWAVGGSLTLIGIDSSSEAQITRDSSQFEDGTHALVTPGRYSMTGDSIDVADAGVRHELCLSDRIGVYTDSTVSLTYEFVPPVGPVYLYRLVPDSSR